MNDICIFLNARVENSEALAWMGDKALTPFRYLFNGKTIRIQPRASDQQIEIHHVASFHSKGNDNCSLTDWKLKSSSTGMIKTVISIVFLIPGLIVGAPFKALAYLFSDVRGKHRLTNEHFTPVNREIGSISNPITTRDQLENALDAELQSDPKNHLTDALIIHGDGNLTINEDPGILKFNPMKLILEGCKIVHEPSAIGRLDDKMFGTGKWQISPVRTITGSDADKSGAKAHRVNSIDDALKAAAPRRSWASCKRYHMIFNV